MNKLAVRFTCLVFATCFFVSTKSSEAALLAVDFGRIVGSVPTPVQPGFSGMAGATSDPLKTNVFGVYNVTVAGDGFYNAGFNAGNVAPSVAALYEDYYYSNSTVNGVGVTLSIAGIAPNTPYDLTLWSYDEDNIFSPTPTVWGPTLTTTGTSGSITDFASPYPTDLSFNSTTIRIQSTTTTLTVFGTTTSGGAGTRINGFSLSAVPEPSSGLLAVICIVTVLGRRGFPRRTY
jgi:hypothetical protein